MKISPQIEAVYQRALSLRQQASQLPIQQDLMDKALGELYFVLDELQAAEAELERQNQALTHTHHSLEAECQRYQDLFHQAPDGSLVTNAKGRIQEGNLAIAAMLNVSQQFLVSKPLTIFIAEAQHPAFHVTLDRLPQLQRIQDWKLHLCPRQSLPFDAIITVTTVHHPRNHGMSLLWLFRHG